MDGWAKSLSLVALSFRHSVTTNQLFIMLTRKQEQLEMWQYSGVRKTQTVHFSYSDESMPEMKPSS